MRGVDLTEKNSFRQASYQRYWFPLVALSFILVSGCRKEHSSATENLKPDESSTSQSVALETLARRKATEIASGPFNPSLEMKENVDFLLTPALLVQQIVSGETEVIYPPE